MTPVEGSKIENSKKVYHNLFPVEKASKRKANFRLGDRVRITKKYKEFRKGYLPNFTTELFIISEILKTDPITYKIKDMNTNETILGTFYELEMSKYNDDLYEIEKVVQTNKIKSL
jgi:hypothetical protein